MTQKHLMEYFKTPEIPSFYSNVEDVGNTASTSHTLALAKAISDGELKDGDELAFIIQASGITIGVCIAALGDLPSRMLKKKSSLQIRTKDIPSSEESSSVYMKEALIDIKRIALLKEDEDPVNDRIARACRGPRFCAVSGIYFNTH